MAALVRGEKYYPLAAMDLVEKNVAHVHIIVERDARAFAAKKQEGEFVHKAVHNIRDLKIFAKFGGFPKNIPGKNAQVGRPGLQNFQVFAERNVHIRREVAFAGTGKIVRHYGHHQVSVVFFEIVKRPFFDGRPLGRQVCENNWLEWFQVLFRENVAGEAASAFDGL